MGRIIPIEEYENGEKCYYCGNPAQMDVFGTDMCADCAYTVFAPVTDDDDADSYDEQEREVRDSGHWDDDEA